MNPIPVSSANIIQFGFTSTFDLENNQLLFDITNQTLFHTGGAANVIGINFQVIDPSGSEISSIDFPSVDISPALGQSTYSVQLSNSAGMFGYYQITGVIRDSNASDYTINFSVNVCKPAGYKAGVVVGKLLENNDCTIPKISVSEVTNLLYNNKQPDTIVKNGTLYYPAGTLDPIVFNYTPINVYGSGNVYTGQYTVRLKTICTYDMGNLAFVSVSYVSSLLFTLTCNSNLCDILCCLKDLSAIVEEGCNTIQAENAKKKLDRATIPLITALTLYKCGEDSDDAVKEVAKILECDCNCDIEIIEPAPIYSTLTPTVLQGQCGTTAVLSNGVWLVKTLNVNVLKDPAATALIITRTQNDCAINFTIGINDTIMAGNVLTAIKNDDYLLSVFNSLVSTTGIDLSMLDGSCVLDTSKCNYSVIVDASNSSKFITQIIINGIIYHAPANLSIANAPSVQSWLNSLSKGVFVVSYDSSTAPASTSISSQQNANKISTIGLIIGTTILTQQFTASCAQVIDIFRAIINYLCNLTDSQIALGRSYAVCTLQADGSIKTEQVVPGTGANMAVLLSKMAAALCGSLTNIAAVSGVNCASIRPVFVNATTIINPAVDALFGTRGGNCGQWSITDIATQLYTFMNTTNNQTLINLMCAVNKRCVVPVCQPVQYASVEMIEPCPAITGITGAFTT